MDTSKRPDNVGILAIEMYFPKRYVAQSDLEEKHNCKGKYTVGLGQINMAFVDDREDITSIFQTAVTALIRKYKIDPMDIGRLEVGTETLIDKSKSVKTSLMSIFGENSDLEGITNVNACYGGTAALFNSIAWIESSEWDGRYALVVCGDIAVYEEGPARPTGGCGALAILLGPNAPLVLEPGVRASHMMDVYDFYKPQHSEYPVVDGKLSQWAFLTSVDRCYNRYKEKYAVRYNKATPVTVDHFDYFAFHTPYNKLIQKGFGRLVYADYKQYYDQQVSQQSEEEVLHRAKSRGESGDGPALEEIRRDTHTPVGCANSKGRMLIPSDVINTQFYEEAKPLLADSMAETIDSREVEMIFRKIGKAKYDSGVTPCCHINQNVGNCYSGSVFSSLLSIVCDKGESLVGKRICMFSYGSGSAASLYSFIGHAAYENGNPNFTLKAIQANMNVFERLASRTRCTVEEFSSALALREQKYAKAPMSPDGEIIPSNYFPLTYYLLSVNDLHHRVYALTPEDFGSEQK